MAEPDELTAELDAISEREQAATPGPWWSDEDELMWRLHGVHGYMPAMPDLGITPQVINHQILKAPKQGTPYAEYWPGEADAAFVTAARTDVPRLLAALRLILDLYARYVTAEDYAAILAALTGQEGGNAG